MTKESKTELKRIEFGHLPIAERIKNFRDFTIPLTKEQTHQQSLRCLHCGTPFCSASCPLKNRPVDFNLFVRNGEWRKAWDCLDSTNPFPEVTSHVCPALCEAGCTEYFLSGSAVGIKTIERAIVDEAFSQGWVKPVKAAVKTGKKVAVIGSGPAGLACAQRLARVGHEVTVYEKAEQAGGLLRYGIPDFKFDKALLDRRLKQLVAEGVHFELSTAVGDKNFDTGVHCQAKKTVTAKALLSKFDAVVIATGSETPRDLKVPGRDGQGVYFALDLLQSQNRRDYGEAAPEISCKDCDVIVIGGGDTGSDCVGTARRQGAKKIYQVDINPRLPDAVDRAAVWPEWPRIFRTSSSQEEGCERDFEVNTKEILLDKAGKVTGVVVNTVKREKDASGRWVFKEVPGSESKIPVQRVLLAMGFIHPSANVLKAFGVEADARGNVKASEDDFASSKAKVFACGDARKGQSLVVYAMAEGCRCAEAVDVFLMGEQAALVAA